MTTKVSPEIPTNLYSEAHRPKSPPAAAHPRPRSPTATSHPRPRSPTATSHSRPRSPAATAHSSSSTNKKKKKDETKKKSASPKARKKLDVDADGKSTSTVMTDANTHREGADHENVETPTSASAGGRVTPNKINFKAVANRVRRNSIDSIGTADELLPSGSGQKPAGLDEPDFWDKASQFSLRMRIDGRYFFQHPYARLLVAYLVTFCNFLIYAEDPVAHSSADCNIVVVGNIYSFVITKYPPNGFSALKVILWVTAIVAGILVGKLVIHKLLLKRLCNLQMFQKDMGSFMVMFLTTLIFLFAFSWLYNAFLLLGGPEMEPYAINGFMSMKNSTFMKAAACGTWLGDFFTAWMVTDVMLQEKFYPEWARGARSWWNTGKRRIIMFWCMALVATILVVIVISTDWIRWDTINASFLATNELSRSFLASFILVMDLLIVMQDWDFPHFINHFDVKLPGLNTADLKINIPQCLKRFEKITIHITGKWFNYGIIFIVMLLDLNMWKNQMFYDPKDFAQYVDDNGYIYSYRSSEIFLKAEGVAVDLNMTTFDKDIRMESRYLDFPLSVKAIAFVPSLAAFAALIALIIIYGRVKPTRSNPYAGRIVKIPKSSKTSLFTLVKMKFMKKSLDNKDTEVAEIPGQYTKNADVSAHNTITI